MVGGDVIGARLDLILVACVTSRLDQAYAMANGAVVAVTLQWDCHNLFEEDDCAPHLLAAPLGERRPYLTTWANYYRRGGAGTELVRDVLQARGLRLLVRAEGTGERLDPLQIVTQFFVALALFPIAAYLAGASPPAYIPISP